MNIPYQVMCRCDCGPCRVARYKGLEKEMHCNIPATGCRVDR